MAFDKTRFRFRKDGDLRLVSHHDLMRAFERMLRRSGLPFRSTEGFHPQPRIVFALSLPLGIAGRQEVVEIEWKEPVEPSEAIARLSSQVVPGLSFFSSKRIDLRQSARPCRAVYRMQIPDSPIDSDRETWRAGIASDRNGVQNSVDSSGRLRSRLALDIDELRSRCAEVMAATEFWVERERPKPREVNIRPYMNELRCGTGTIEIDIWITQEGSARADEIVRGLGLGVHIDDGAIIERTVLEIEDEIDAATSLNRPKLPGRNDRAALERPLKQLPKNTPPLQAAHSAHWGASPSGPIVE